MKNRALQSLAALALLSLTTAAFAQGCDGPCPPPPGPVGPPPAPPLPNGMDVGASFFAYPGYVVQGGIANGDVYTFGGGAGTPYVPGQLLQFGNNDSKVGVQISLAPIASALATATQSARYGRSQADAGLGYRVMLVAPDQTAADYITSLLGSSGAIARVHGLYTLTASGYGYGSASVSTGTTGLDPSLAASEFTRCGTYGVITAPGTAGCGTRSFDLPLNFVAGSYFAGGDPLSFVATLTLSVEAQAGLAGAFSGNAGGDFSAFIDPTVVLANGIHAGLVLGDNGNVSNLSPVPEPQQWALWLAGLVATGAALRRRRLD